MCPFSNIYSLAMVTIGDYKISKLLSFDKIQFYEYMRSLLIRGSLNFQGCLQSLEYVSAEELDEDGIATTVWYFTSDLSTKEQLILANTIVLTWWEQKIQDVTVFQGSIPNKDFSKMEIASGLKQKSEYKDKLGEELDRAITSYQLDSSNFSKLPFFGGV